MPQNSFSPVTRCVEILVNFRTCCRGQILAQRPKPFFECDYTMVLAVSGSCGHNNIYDDYTFKYIAPTPKYSVLSFEVYIFKIKTSGPI